MATSKILDQLALRLPDAIRPTKYLLRLHPNLNTKIFAGNVTIRLELLKPIAFIPVHSKSLEVSTQKVVKTSPTGEKLADIKPSLTFGHSELEYWVTEFEKPLDNGNYELSLEFKGSLKDKIVGFYQSNYFDSTKSQKRWIATTKFEPTYARHAFPCFDEPALKATFQITVVCPNGDGYHALSNMNVENEKIFGDVTEVTFVESVPMSTYLACFIVSDFAHKAKMVKGSLEEAKDFEMRVFSTAAQLNKVSYALDIGAGITEYYIQYFSVPYPLPKLDMAAIPDFVSGAMEHWGLVTYRETALLYDEAISSCEDKQLVAKVVAHELAHMWFGNLVTMKWWNDLWLNEGFASYIEYKGINEVHPDWQMLDQFLIGDMHEVMRLDATLGSHPIVQTVHTPSQITELFDTITYSKGAAIIRMLEDMVGAEKFRNATQSYLKKFCYQNAETNDFLNEIEAQEFDFDVKLIMRTWTEQMGLPVLEVLAESDTTFKLTQNRFLCNPQNYKLQQKDSPFNYCWSIPVTYFTSADSEVKRSIFNYNDLDLKVTVPSVINWIKFNKNQMGYYLVNYPAEMWRAFTSTLMSSMSSFSVSDRVHLLSDAFFLADASQLDYSIVLDLTKYLELERDYAPWYVAHCRLDAIGILLWSTDLYHDFELYVRQLVNTLYESLTWNVSDDHMQNMLRVTILSLACRFGHPAALEEAGARFNSWLSNPTLRPHPDLRDTVYYYGMQVVGGEHAWNQVWNLFIAETDAQEKVKLMQALSAIKEPQILQRYINMAWNEDNVRRQDYFNCLKYISKNQIGQYLVWDYVRENWLRFVDRFGISERYLGRLIPAITSHFVTRTKLEEMEALFTKYPVAGAGTTARKEALERVKCNIQWLEENMSSVGRWFSFQKGDGDESQQE